MDQLSQKRKIEQMHENMIDHVFGNETTIKNYTRENNGEKESQQNIINNIVKQKRL